MDVHVFEELLDQERHVGRMTGTLQDNHLVQFLGHHPREVCGVFRRRGGGKGFNQMRRSFFRRSVISEKRTICVQHWKTLNTLYELRLEFPIKQGVLRF